MWRIGPWICPFRFVLLLVLKAASIIPRSEKQMFLLSFPRIFPTSPLAFLAFIFPPVSMLALFFHGCLDVIAAHAQFISTFITVLILCISASITSFRSLFQLSSSLAKIPS